MRKRGAVSVDVGEISVRFHEDNPFVPTQNLLVSQAQLDAVSSDTEVHDAPGAEAEAAPDGPLSGALKAPKAAEATPEEQAELFDTWYHTQPKPTSFAR